MQSSCSWWLGNSLPMRTDSFSVAKKIRRFHTWRNSTISLLVSHLCAQDPFGILLWSGGASSRLRCIWGLLQRTECGVVCSILNMAIARVARHHLCLTGATVWVCFHENGQWFCGGGHWSCLNVHAIVKKTGRWMSADSGSASMKTFGAALDQNYTNRQRAYEISAPISLLLHYSKI